jgi:hypothetical protein
MNEPGRLFLDGLNDLGVAVAGVGHPNAGGEIQVLAAGRIVEVATFGPLDQDVGKMGPHRGKGGTGDAGGTGAAGGTGVAVRHDVV